jgi:O-antigen/teichoic acid export membrane protein
VNRLSRLFWVVCDQGIFALSNFLLNLLFMRWLAPTEYGLFAVSFSGFLLFSVFEWAMVVEPLLIQFASIPPPARAGFLRSAMLAHGILNMVVAVVSAAGSAVAWALGAPQAALGMLGAGIGGSLLMALVAARRLCVVVQSARTSAIVGLGYFAAVTATSLVLFHFHLVEWFTLWFVMGGWSLVGAVVICALMQQAAGPRMEPYGILPLIRFQWRYARWGTLATACNWVRGSGVLLLLSQFAGLAAIAGAQAMVLLTNPIAQINGALNITWLVEFGDRSNHANDPTGPNVRRWLMFYSGGAVVLVILAAVAAHPVVHVIYHGRYDAYAWLLPVLAGGMMCDGLESLFTARAKTMGALQTGYLPAPAGSVIAVVLSCLLIPTWGVSGAVFTIAASSLVGCAVAAVMTARPKKVSAAVPVPL